MSWIAVITVVLFVVTRWMPKVPNGQETRHGISRPNPASIVLTDDITVRPV